MGRNGSPDGNGIGAAGAPPLRTGRVAKGAWACALLSLIATGCGLASLVCAAVYFFLLADRLTLKDPWGVYVENTLGSGVVYGIALGLILAIVSILLARGAGRREPLARWAIRFALLALAGCVVFAYAFIVTWAIDYR